GVLGANGAGKTTLMRLILGLLAVSAGTVRLFGQPPSRETRRRTGYVPQGLGLYRDLTAGENLAFSAAAFGVAAVAPPPGVGDTTVGHLPLGLQRQVAFAAALQHRPELLVLDEPTSGVAPLTRARLWDRIREQAAAGTAVLVTTHYMDEARQADRLVLMARGRVAGRGGEAEIVGSSRAVVVRAGDWAEAFSALEAAGLAASLVGRDVRIPGADLEAVRRALAAARITAAVETAPATLEEAMVLAGRGEGP
ncbi:MAG TPA: ATP-binding cassette domain-containing protein, partial [Acidimicrobiia bacterium]|nr:ATP-binding cassette domain-containing protein [Acidimicrobiia bacterium]